MLPTMVTKNVIAPRRQARKKRPLFISPNLGDLCAFARGYGFFFSPAKYTKAGDFFSTPKASTYSL
jgi:hypothetical protein